jgi:hypothetical protein
MGAVTLICGFAMMWGSTAGTHATRTTYQALLDAAIEIDPSQPDSSDNGKVVVAAARLSSPAPLGDEYIKPGSYLKLKRHVEMYQWVEEWPSKSPVYRLKWFEGAVDSLKFKVLEGHVNPFLKIVPREWTAEHAVFGAFDGRKILSVIEKLERLKLTRDMVIDPAVEVTDDTLVVKYDKATAGPAVGDVRIWYDYLPAGDYTVLATQADEMTLVGANPSQDVVITAGKHDLKQLVALLSGEAQHGFSNLLFIGGAILFLGLITAIRRALPDLDLRPRIPVTGVAAAAVVAFIITLVVMVLFVVLSFLG